MARGNKRTWAPPRLRGLRKRWVFNTVIPVFLLLALLVLAVSAGISNYYYGTMREGLETRAQTMANSFNEYFMSNGYSSYIQKATQTAENFEDKGCIELQFISSKTGRIQVSTSGLTAGTSPGTDDISLAISANQRMDDFFL